MSLDVAYSYCTKLTEQEKLDIDKQVRKNRLELIIALFCPFAAVPIPPPQISLFYRGDDPGRPPIERNLYVYRGDEPGRPPTGRNLDECNKPSKEFKVYSNMTPTLSKISKSVRSDKETSKTLDKLYEQLKNAEFHAGRGAQKLDGTETVFYLRAGNRARLFFRYLENERGAVEVIAESNKSQETAVIKNIQNTYR